METSTIVTESGRRKFEQKRALDRIERAEAALKTLTSTPYPSAAQGSGSEALAEYLDQFAARRREEDRAEVVLALAYTSAEAAFFDTPALRSAMRRAAQSLLVLLCQSLGSEKFQALSSGVAAELAAKHGTRVTSS